MATDPVDVVPEFEYNTFMVDITKHEVLHLGQLARLHLTDQEIDTYAPQIDNALHYVERLKDIDTTGATDTVRALDQKNIFFADGSINERGLSSEEATANAPKQKKQMFVVPAVITQP